MPVDPRRFTGPETSIPYKNLTKDFFKSLDQLSSEVLNEKGLRKDGRAEKSSRPIFMKSGVISQAKGSAYIEMGKTKVICSVFDPREIQHQDQFGKYGEVFCEVKRAPFSCARERRQHAPDEEEKALSVTLKKAIEPALHSTLFANYQVDIFAYILENDGACLAAVINAASLALSDAAIPMLDLITASTVAVHNDRLILDPTESEEYTSINCTGQNNGVVTISMLAYYKQITSLNQVGSMDFDCVSSCIDLLTVECQNILTPMHYVIFDSVQRGLKVKRTAEYSMKCLEANIDKKIEELKDKMKDMNK